MHSAKPYVVIVLVLAVLCFETESTSSGNNTRETIPGKRDDTGDIGDHTTDVIVLAVALAAFVLVELIKLALDRTTVMALAVWSLAAALLIAVIALTVVLFLKRRKRRPQDAERPNDHETLSILLENQNGTTLNPENAATQLGLSETENAGIGGNEYESPERPDRQSKWEYAVLSPLTMMPSCKSYTSLEEVEQEFSDNESYWDESPTYVNQVPMPEYMNVPM